MAKRTTLYVALAVVVVVTLFATLALREHFRVSYTTPGSSRSITVSGTGDGPSHKMAEGRHISSISVAKDWAVHAYPDTDCKAKDYKTYNEGTHTSVKNPVRCLFPDNLKIGTPITPK